MGCGASRRNVVPERVGSAKENGSTHIKSPVRADVAQQQQSKELRRKMIQERQLRTVSAAQELSGQFLEDRDRLSISITNGTSHLSSRTSSPHGSRTNSKRVHFEERVPEREGPIPSKPGLPASSLHAEPTTVAVR